MRPLASEASRQLFRSSPLDWLKMHCRTFPAVKMSEIFNHEAPYTLGPWSKLPLLPPSQRPWLQVSFIILFGQTRSRESFTFELPWGKSNLNVKIHLTEISYFVPKLGGIFSRQPLQETFKPDLKSGQKLPNISA